MATQILHIHQDYPDNLGYPATKAVSNLIHASRVEFPLREHFVLSIHRTANPFKVRVRSFEDGISFVYWGIPIPGLHVLTLWIAALFVRWFLRGRDFDLIHGHKLTTEGVMTYFLSKWRSVPYILSIRGGSDIHNLTRFPIHRPFYRTVFENAAHVFWVSPWASQKIQNWCGIKSMPIHLFPNICEINMQHAHEQAFKLEKPLTGRFLAVINYSQYKRKGILSLIEAFKCLQQKGLTGLSLDVYGQDAPENRRMLQELVESQQLSDSIRIHGAIGQEQLRGEMRGSLGMVLPSINETFGMSYIEALSVNCPIMYMANTGVDGFFDEYTVGVRVQSQEPQVIENALITLVENREEFLKGIQNLHQQHYLKSFTSQTLADNYEAVIKKVVI